MEKDQQISIRDIFSRLFGSPVAPAENDLDLVTWDEARELGPVLARLEELTGSTYVWPEALGTQGAMPGVSIVAIRFLLVIDDEIEDRFRPRLLDILPEVASASEERVDQQIGVAVDVICRDLTAAAMTAAGGFSADEIGSLKTAVSRDELKTRIDGLFDRIETKLLDTENAPAHDPLRENLVHAGRVLAGASAVVRQADAPAHCVQSIRATLVQAAQIIDAETFADMTIRALQRIASA